jgi:hypothetical protein
LGFAAPRKEGGHHFSRLEEPESNVVRTALFNSILSMALLSPYCIHAQDASVFRKWLDQSAHECVPVTEFKSMSRVIELTPEQFQFVRALYVALPPISRTLPPGDHAVMASAGDETMLALVADGQSCARFLAPQFILEMLIQVGEGKTVNVGEP